MRIIESLELEKWSEPDETGHVHLVGMEKAQEAFDRLEAHLKDVGMMPDEYFLFNDSRFKNEDTLPRHRGVLCNVEFGASERQKEKSTGSLCAGDAGSSGTARSRRFGIT